MTPPAQTSSRAHWPEIAGIFGRLGCLGFGGPLALMAMMEEEISRRRKWLSAKEFAEVYALCKILPGPVATQMAIYLGYRRGGRVGGLIAGGLLILPAFLLVLGLSWLYRNSGVVHKLGPLLLGMQAAALAVVALSTLQLARPFGRDVRPWITVAAAATATFLLPSFEPLYIIGAGVLGIVLARARVRRDVKLLSAAPLLVLFWVCLKAGALVFGTGLAIVPMLQHAVVTEHGWLTASEFIDGIAIGQITPGPVTITSTFIGYLTAGVAGACVATLGVFLPAFINVLFIVPKIWNRVSGSAGAAAFTAWAIPAVVGGIIGTLVRIAPASLHSIPPVAIAALALAVGLKWKPPAWALIPAGGALLMAWSLLG